MFDPDGLLTRLKQLVCTEHIVVAFSGGLDSSVLLHALANLRDRQQVSGLRAIHVNHGLSSEAASWQAYCERVCARFDIPLQIERVTVERGAGGLEAAARQARYAALRAGLSAGDNLLTAQHLDDQAETVLLRLLRGAGPRGLGAIRDMRELGAARLVRPLLAWSRAELLDYAERAGIEWIEDPSNEDSSLDRNYLRQRVMPTLEERWPGYAGSFAQSAQLAHQANLALNEHAREKMEQTDAVAGVLSCAWLGHQSDAMQGILLQEWARMLGLTPPGANAIARIRSEVLTARPDAMPCVEWGKREGLVEIRRYRDSLYLMAALLPHDASQRLAMTLEPVQRLPHGGRLVGAQAVGRGVDAEFLKHAQIRFRQGGERCTPAGRCGSHPLKKLFQEYGVPPWKRARIPLIYSGEELVAVPGLFVCEGYAAGPSSEGWEFSWQPGSIERPSSI